MKSKVVVLIYTYDRVDDAKINQEIIRENWTSDKGFEEVKIVHTFNGEKSWWQEKYLEDDLLYLDNVGLDHFGGAELMMNEGISYISTHYSNYDYVIVLASDTWLTKPDYVATLLKKMSDEEKYLATCAWGTKEKHNIWNIGMGLDFYILDLQWLKQSKMFPLRFDEFSKKYEELFSYKDDLVFLERVFAVRFKEAIRRIPGLVSTNQLKKLAEKHLLRFIEREPIHLKEGFFKKKKFRKMNWPELGLLGDHYPEPKKKLLKKLAPKLGEHGRKLLESKDLSYWNGGKKELYRA